LPGVQTPPPGYGGLIDATTQESIIHKGTSLNIWWGI
jgi:hypothetical protein